jgi:hypothetical protein
MFSADMCADSARLLLLLTARLHMLQPAGSTLASPPRAIRHAGCRAPAAAPPLFSCTLMKRSTSDALDVRSLPLLRSVRLLLGGCRCMHGAVALINACCMWSGVVMHLLCVQCVARVSRCRAGAV